MASDEPFVLAQRVGKILVERGETLAVVEGATGGAIAHLLTSVLGSSAWFRAGIIAYTDYPKQLLLRVSTDTIIEKGGISADATVQMARLARRLFSTDWSVALTGYADSRAPVPDDQAPSAPKSDQPNAPKTDSPRSEPQAGLTYLAVSRRIETEPGDTQSWEERLLAAPDRVTYKQEAASAAIEMLLLAIENEPS